MALILSLGSLKPIISCDCQAFAALIHRAQKYRVRLNDLAFRRLAVQVTSGIALALSHVDSR